MQLHDATVDPDAGRIPATVHLERDGVGVGCREVERVRAVPQGCVLLKLAGIDSRNDAEVLRGVEILADRGDLEPLGESEWYVADLVGLRAVSPDGGALGSVRDVYFNGAHEVLVIDTPEGDVEVPFAEVHVGDVDLEGGTVVLLDLAALRL